MNEQSNVRKREQGTVPVAPSTIACSDQTKGEEDEAVVVVEEEGVAHKPLIARSKEGN